jgi:type IV pilus assembly protein PilF
MKRLTLLVFFFLAACVSTGGTPPIEKSKMAEGYFQKGLAFFQERNLEMASVEFNRSIQTDRSYKLSYYYLGLISDSQDKLTEAIKYYKDAIDIDSGFSEAYNALGAVYSKQTRWDDAIKSYQKALENKLYTTPHVPYINLGRVYMAQKNYPKAVEAFRDAKNFVKQDFIIYELGNALVEAGKIKEAISEFQEGVGIAPQNAPMRYGLALALLKDGNKKASVQEFRKVTELAPKSDLALKARDYLKTLR